MLDDLRHWELEDEVVDSLLACDIDLPNAAVEQDVPVEAASTPPPAGDDDEEDVDPSIR